MKQYASFKEWSRAGFKIKKGTHSLFREEGIPMFTQDQVERTTFRPRTYSSSKWTPCNMEQEEANEFAEIHGDDAYAFGADF